MASALNLNRFRSLINKTNETEIDLRVFGKKVGFLTKFFGCEHRNISRPFIAGKVSYRTCLQCGARKQFNTETFKTFGDFYYPPAERMEIGL
jgi:hypothetical protein